MKKNEFQYKGFSGTVEWSEDDKVFHGKVNGVYGHFHYEGKTIDELREDFHELIDEYIEECKEKGIDPKKPYNGIFNIRVGSELHMLAIEKAKEEGISLNKLVKNALKAYLL